MKESKELILNSAFSLFLQKSYKEVTLNDIVKTTGLSKGAFYYYFESKEKLFAEVLEVYLFDKMRINYQDLNHNSLREFYHGYIKKFKGLFNELIHLLNDAEPREHLNYITIMFDAIRLFPEFREQLIIAKNEEVEAWKKIVKIARKNNEIRSPMTDLQITRMFIFSNDGIGLNLFISGQLENAEKEILTLWDNFYKEIAY